MAQGSPNSDATTTARLAVFIPTFLAGGAERVALILAGEFSRQGYDVDLVAVDPRGELASEAPASVRVVVVRGRTPFGRLWRLMRYLRQERPRALLASLPQANFLSVLAKRLVHSPTRVCITEVHNPSAHVKASHHRWRRKVALHLMRWLYPKADLAVAVSEGVASDVRRILGRGGKRLPIEVVHNPVVTPALVTGMMAPATHSWFSDDGPPVILGVGRLAECKGFDVLLTAVANLRRQRPARVMILGEGPLRRALEAHAASLGLTDADVCLPGFIQNPFPALKHAAVFALTSTYEGFGNVLVEAMACGTPVVSTDCPGGPREILQGGEFGSLVPVGDARALANALQAALTQPPPRERLRRRADDFRSDRIAAQYVALLLGHGRHFHAGGAGADT